MANTASSLYAYILLCILRTIFTQKSSMYQLTDQIKNDILKWHNFYRDQVARGNVTGQPAGKIDKLGYDDDLAKFAYNYMDSSIKKGQCPAGHNPDHCFYHGSTVEAVGENIAWGQMDVGQGIKNWFDEHSNYKYSKSPDGKIKPEMHVGHYTQVVAARSKKVGCAIAQDCDQKGTTFKMMLLCNYVPAGNMNGEYPYTDKETLDQNNKNGSMDSCQMKENQKGNWDSAGKSLQNGTTTTNGDSAASTSAMSAGSTTTSKYGSNTVTAISATSITGSSAGLTTSNVNSASMATVSGSYAVFTTLNSNSESTTASLTITAVSTMAASGSTNYPLNSAPTRESGGSSSSVEGSRTAAGFSSAPSSTTTPNAVTTTGSVSVSSAVPTSPAATTLPLCPFAALDTADKTGEDMATTEEATATTTAASRPSDKKRKKPKKKRKLVRKHKQKKRARKLVKSHAAAITTQAPTSPSTRRRRPPKCIPRKAAQKKRKMK